MVRPGTEPEGDAFGKPEACVQHDACYRPIMAANPGTGGAMRQLQNAYSRYSGAVRRSQSRS
jgi:hypothetical protein